MSEFYAMHETADLIERITMTVAQTFEPYRVILPKQPKDASTPMWVRATTHRSVVVDGALDGAVQLCAGETVEFRQQKDENGRFLGWVRKP